MQSFGFKSPSCCTLCSSKQAFYLHINKTVETVWLIYIFYVLQCKAVILALICDLRFPAQKPNNFLYVAV